MRKKKLPFPSDINEYYHVKFILDAEPDKEHWLLDKEIMSVKRRFALTEAKEMVSRMLRHNVCAWMEKVP